MTDTPWCERPEDHQGLWKGSPPRCVACGVLGHLAHSPQPLTERELERAFGQPVLGECLRRLYVGGDITAVPTAYAFEAVVKAPRKDHRVKQRLYEEQQREAARLGALAQAARAQPVPEPLPPVAPKPPRPEPDPEPEAPWVRVAKGLPAIPGDPTDPTDRAFWTEDRRREAAERARRQHAERREREAAVQAEADRRRTAALARRRARRAEARASREPTTIDVVSGIGLAAPAPIERPGGGVIES